MKKLLPSLFCISALAACGGPLEGELSATETAEPDTTQSAADLVAGAPSTFLDGTACTVDILDDPEFDDFDAALYSMDYGYTAFHYISTGHHVDGSGTGRWCAATKDRARTKAKQTALGYAESSALSECRADGYTNSYCQSRCESAYDSTWSGRVDFKRTCRQYTGIDSSGFCQTWRARVEGTCRCVCSKYYPPS